jgi:hypothetical protein
VLLSKPHQSICKSTSAINGVKFLCGFVGNTVLKKVNFQYKVLIYFLTIIQIILLYIYATIFTNLSNENRVDLMNEF